MQVRSKHNLSCTRRICWMLWMYTFYSEIAKILIQYVNELGGAEADKIAMKPKGASNKRDGQHSSDFAMMTSDIDPTDYRKSTCLSSVFAVFGSQYWKCSGTYHQQDGVWCITYSRLKLHFYPQARQFSPNWRLTGYWRKFSAATSHVSFSRRSN